MDSLESTRTLTLTISEWLEIERALTTRWQGMHEADPSRDVPIALIGVIGRARQGPNVGCKRGHDPVYMVRYHSGYRKCLECHVRGKVKQVVSWREGVTQLEHRLKKVCEETIRDRAVPGSTSIAAYRRFADEVTPEIVLKLLRMLAARKNEEREDEWAIQESTVVKSRTSHA